MSTRPEVLTRRPFYKNARVAGGAVAAAALIGLAAFGGTRCGAESGGFKGGFEGAKTGVEQALRTPRPSEATGTPTPTRTEIPTATPIVLATPTAVKSKVEVEVEVDVKVDVKTQQPTTTPSPKPTAEPTPTGAPRPTATPTKMPEATPTPETIIDCNARMQTFPPDSDSGRGHDIRINTQEGETAYLEAWFPFKSTENSNYLVAIKGGHVLFRDAAGTMFVYPSNCPKSTQSQQIKDHIERRRKQGQTIIIMSIDELALVFPGQIIKLPPGN